MGSPLTPETLVYDIRAATDPRISPDGSMIVYALAGVDPETKQPGSQLWVCDRDGSNNRRITWSGRANSSPRWSPDGSKVLFLSDRTGTSGVYILPVAGGEARQLLSRPGPIAELDWSPDGRWIIFTAAVDPEDPEGTPPAPGAPPKVRVTRRVDYKADLRGWVHNTRFQIFIADAETGEARQITSELNDHSTPAISPDGRSIAYTVGAGDNMCNRLVIQDLTTDATREVISTGRTGVFAWSPTGDRLIAVADPDLNVQPDFYVIDTASGAVRRITDDLDVQPGSIFPLLAPPEPPVWLDERQVLFLGGREGANGLYVVDSEGGAVEPVFRAPAMLGGLSLDARHRYAVQSLSGFDSFGEIVVYDNQAGQVRQITAINAATFAEHPPASGERIAVDRGEFQIDAWILHPPGFDPTKRYPVIMDIHGGPHGAYGPFFLSWQQLLATNGFLVVIANPRGSTTYGRDFATRVVGDIGGEDYRDLLAVFDAVLERPYADAGRTGIFGYSYGGFMTSWMLGQTTRFHACVCGAPPFDLESMYGTSDMGVFARKLVGALPHEAPETYARLSPSTLAHRATTPTLIIVGEADERCPIGQAEYMFTVLKQAGCEVELARYPGGNHLFPFMGLPEHRVDVHRRILDWFTERLKE